MGSNAGTSRGDPLVAGRDYPRTHAELVQMFADEQACARYLERLRWPGALSAPRRAERLPG